MTPVIEFHDVCFSYGEQEVLHRVSFSVEPNSFVGIVGPNGGGKTTLLRLMLGLEVPRKGGVALFGRRPEQGRGRCGYVMQHMHYDERFPATVREVVLMGRAGRRVWGVYGAGDRRAAHGALERVGMAGFGKRPFAALSGGQQQRVLIAQALANEPELLLLDEPTANIDSEGEKTIHDLLNGLARQLTVLMVSHNLNAVLGCATHVLCVNKSVTMNRLDSLNPETLKRTYGGDIAVVHHALNCGVFDRSSKGSCPVPAAVESRSEAGE